MQFEAHFSCVVDRKEAPHVCEDAFTIPVTASDVDEAIGKCKSEILRQRKEGAVSRGVKKIELNDFIEITKFPDVAVTKYDVAIPAKDWVDHVCINPFKPADLTVWQWLRALKEHADSDTARVLPFLEFGPESEPTVETL